MRGMLHRTRRWLCLLLAGALIAGTSFQAPPVSASNSLDLARDTIGILTPGFPEVYHEIYFVLPVSAQQVQTTDTILIRMPNYTDINTDGLYVTGVYGTPLINRTGTTISITNVAILPGMGVTVLGFFARNPYPGLSPQVEVVISSNSNGIPVRNGISIVPTDSRTVVNVTAQIQSPKGVLRIMGWTSPSTFVTLTEGISVLGTTLSDGEGAFVFNLSGLEPGMHTYRIFATDQANRSTAQSSLNLFLVANMLTTASNIILSSTLSISPPEIEPAQPIVFSGTAKPESQINIFVESPLRSYVTTSDLSGTWSFTMDSTETEGLMPGEYRVYTIVQDSLGTQSVISPTVNFTVTAPSNPNNPPPSCDISRGDLNCDGNVNLTDFSILLFHWNTDHRVADINADGMVNLIDFSIMMFNFSS